MKKYFFWIILLLLFFSEEGRVEEKTAYLRDPFKPLITGEEGFEKQVSVSGEETFSEIVSEPLPGLRLVGIFKFRGEIVAILEEENVGYTVRTGDLIKNNLLVKEIDFRNRYVILEDKKKGVEEKIKLGGE